MTVTPLSIGGEVVVRLRSRLVLRGQLTGADADGITVAGADWWRTIPRADIATIRAAATDDLAARPGRAR